MIATIVACSAEPLPEAVRAEAVERALEGVTRDREWTAEQIDATYAAREGRPLWVGAGGPTRDGRRLLETLEEMEAEGFPPAYEAALIEGLQDRLASADSAAAPGARAELEMRLSVAFLGRVRDLVRGRLDPARFAQDWRIESEPLPEDALVRVSDGDSPDEILDGLRPSFPHYERLVEALDRLGDVARSGGWPALGAEGPLAPGERSPVVNRLRERLAASDDPGERRLAGRGDEPDLFDEDLAAALERFQMRHGLEPDRILGPATLRELGTPVEDRIRSVRVNLDRLRWLPRDLGPRAIPVNVAGFEFELLEDNEPRFSMNVVVGRAEWATRLFSATMDHLVLNPYWHVPEPILRDEVLPAIRNDPGYASRNGFEVVWADGARPAGGADWEALASRIDDADEGAESLGDDTLEVTVRQAPGPTNALGRVKFMFPNPYHIYLHDSPEQALFERSYRAFSHGCIRVERPIELARYLVDRYTERPVDDIARILASEEETTIVLDEPLEVYTVYLTAWVDGDGTTYFYRDIYDRDDALHAGERVSIVRPAKSGARGSALPGPAASRGRPPGSPRLAAVPAP